MRIATMTHSRARIRVLANFINNLSLKTQRRTLLKSWIQRNRKTITKKGYTLQCPICEKPILYGFDMHEALITRGRAQGNKELGIAIMVRENCVAVHHDCHIRHGNTRWVRDKCLRQLLALEGFGNIIGWLTSLHPIARSTLIDETIRYVEAAQEELVQRCQDVRKTQDSSGRIVEPDWHLAVRTD